MCMYILFVCVYTFTYTSFPQWSLAINVGASFYFSSFLSELEFQFHSHSWNVTLKLSKNLAWSVDQKGMCKINLLLKLKSRCWERAMGEMDLGIWVTGKCLILSDEMGCWWKKIHLKVNELPKYSNNRSCNWADIKPSCGFREHFCSKWNNILSQITKISLFISWNTLMTSFTSKWNIYPQLIITVQNSIS